MTDHEFPTDWPSTVWSNEEWHEAFQNRLIVWANLPHPKPHVLRYMHMTIGGFLYWRETGIVPRETRILITLFPEFLNE